MDKLKIEYVDINNIKPYKKNPRKNDEAIPYVMESIKQFGFKNPVILDKDNVIVAGHTRIESAKRLGITEIPCIYADDLTDEQIKAFRLADNKVAEIAEWDIDLLDTELDDILDIDMTDFGFEKTIEEKVKEAKKDGDVEFSEVLGEEHNYIVLYFDNDVDWLQAQTLFDIKPVKCGSTRKDGKITKSMQRIGIGRVLNGAEAINKILEK